jgi:hypothetical protein
MSYHERGKHNPFDAYMAGFCWWQSPRQILINEKALKAYTSEPGVELKRTRTCCRRSSTRPRSNGKVCGKQ